MKCSVGIRQSKTLPQAVAEYTRRYGRAPPKGFEGWWQFCKKNNVKIVDDVRDQAYSFIVKGKLNGR